MFIPPVSLCDNLIFSQRVNYWATSSRSVCGGSFTTHFSNPSSLQTPADQSTSWCVNFEAFWGYLCLLRWKAFRWVSSFAGKRLCLRHRWVRRICAVEAVSTLCLHADGLQQKRKMTEVMSALIHCSRALSVSCLQSFIGINKDESQKERWNQNLTTAGNKCIFLVGECCITYSFWLKPY